VEIVKRINNASEAIEFLQKIEQLNRWSRKFVVLDCPTDMAKEIVKSHVRDVSLGKRTYHYLLSGLVSSSSHPTDNEFLSMCGEAIHAWQSLKQ
jgi:glutamate receptor, ionotropic, invertebrate